MEVTALKWIFTHLTPSNLLMCIICYGIFKIYSKVRNFDDRVFKLEKKQGKMIQVMEQCPSIPKSVVAWLGDDRQNSKPPEKSLCLFPNTERGCNENINNKS